MPHAMRSDMVRSIRLHHRNVAASDSRAMIALSLRMKARWRGRERGAQQREKEKDNQRIVRIGKAIDCAKRPIARQRDCPGKFRPCRLERAGF